MKRSIQLISGMLLSCFFLSLSSPLFSQQEVIRCHTTHMDSLRHAKNPDLQSNEEFERWMAKEVEAWKSSVKPKIIINGVYQIPVVFHVVHRGTEGIGTGRNISQATVQSQVDVLNEDFRKIFGTNGDNSHPDGADTQIEFCLAKRRPDGSAFAEDGINRINGNAQGWGNGPFNTGFIDGTIKPFTNAQGYDPGVYMNMWICDISGGILGYAQFPTTVLGGMGCGAQSQTTDGVVMLYNSIGKSSVTGFPGPYNEGRTATHEIGHWLGLRHIWGDGGCGVDDFCSDTPVSDNPNFGCPGGHVSCGTADMIENYMDYTDDLCMNIFTYDQKMRMRIVLENSPIRASLITSDACIPPAVSDASIINITSPAGDNCPGSITPTVTLRNRGSSNLTSATIEYTIDNGTPTAFNWTGSITPGNQANVNLPAFTSTLGTHTLRAYSILPNGVTDPDPTYDTTTIQFVVSNGIMPDYAQDFDGGVFPPDLRWSVDNPNGDCYEWIGGTGVSSTGAANNASAMMPNYQNSTNQSEYLYTPIFILPCNASVAELVFDLAYRQRVTTVDDRLRIEMSLDCGNSWSGTPIYDKSGDVGANPLATTPAVNAYYIPTAAGQWRNEVVNLMPFVTGTSQNVQFRFRATNVGNGGNIYVDNVEFNAITPGEINITIGGNDVLDGGAYNYGTVAMGSTTTAVFTIENTGTSNLILTPPISVTGDPEFSLNATFGTTTVPPGGTTTFSIDFDPATAGAFTGNVSFATNDCDEGVYNFQLNGQTNTSPPTAGFNANPTTICEGSTVTYTDASSGAATWDWTFPGGTPATASGVGPHVVTYATAGTFDAELDVTNLFGSDNDTQTGLITVISTGGTASLPINEGFVNPAFPPAGWTVVNGGTAQTWVRSGTQGTAPTAGNSAVIDNFNAPNPTGSQDDLVLPAADFTGFSSAQLQFDVAYARYDGVYFDRLDVLVSDDCGQTYTTVFSKAGTVLATDPDQTGGYTNPATWRPETIDLSAFVGSPKVDVVFRCISGYGQFLYIDNINLTGVLSLSSADFTAAPDPACVNETVTFTDASIGATSWDWDFGAGATPATATGVGPHDVTYATSGVKNVSLDINSGADVSNQTVTINPLEDASFNYASTSYCANDADPTPTITGVGGGAFSSIPGGLSINPSTGVVDLSASTSGAYTITYTTPGTCSNSSNVSFTVNPTPATPIITPSGSTTFCAGGSVDLTSSQASGNLWSTGETTQMISVTTSGSYSVTFTDGNGCSATSATTNVTVNPTPATPTITPSGSTTFCDGGSVDLTSSQASGNLWSTGETTQMISVTTSGSYSVTFTDGNGCSATSATTNVTVNPTPATPTITPSGSTTFCDGGSVDLTSSQASGNLWSTGETTQMISVTTSGSYSVTFTDGNGCSATSATTNVTVNPTPAAPAITPSGSTTFCDGGSVDLTSSQASGNLWSTGETTQVISVTTSGSYSVTFTDGNGCSATSATTNVTVNPTPATPTITPSGSTTFCDGGSVDLTSSQASGNLWSTGETTQMISVTTSGSYSVTFTDGNGCSATSATTNVTVNPTPATPTITPSGSTTFCDGGSVNLTSSQASGNLWSTGETTQMISVATSGSYSVTFTDGNGCSATSATTNVTVNPTPATPTITPSGSTTFCDGGSVTLTSSQGSGNLWSTSSTSNNIIVTTSGSYTVTFTDGNGCSATSAATVVTVNPAPVISIGTVNDPSTCATATGDIEITGAGTGVVNWTGTATGSSGSVTLPYVISGLTAGSYNITFTDASTCVSNSLNQTLTDPSAPPAPTITPSGPTTFCAGGSVDLTSSEPSGNLWSTGATTQLISVTTSGTYSVTYTDGFGCSSSSAPVVVTVNANPAAPTITPSGSTTFCDGGSVDLVSSEGSGNLWSTGETTQLISVTTSGSYSVTFTDGNGCSATSATTNVTVNPTPATPTITPSGPITFCDGGSVDLTSSQASGNLWSTGETTQMISVTTSGSYSVTFTDGNGCSATSAATNVTVNPSAVIAFGTITDPATCGTSTGSLEITGTGTGIVNWSGTVSGSSGSVTLPYAITGLPAGSYTISFDQAGCISNVLNQSLTDPSAPPAPIITASGSTTFCDGGSVDLTSSQPSGNLWSTGATTQMISVTTSGTYTATYTDGFGCTSSSSVPVVVTVNPTPAAPTITASGSTTFCAGGSVDLTSSQASGNLWSTGETTQMISVTTSGSYSVTFTDGNGCSATSATTNVTVNPTPSAPTITPSGSTTFCDGGSVDLTSSQASGNLWSTGETTQMISVTISGSYSVTFTDGNGCSATSATTNVTVNPTPATPIITPSGSTTICDGGSVDLTSSQASGNLWSTGETTQMISVTTSGSYSVTFTDGNGCSATSATTNLTVNPTPATPTITQSGATTFCDGGSVDLTSSQASGNLWSTGETTQMITVTTSGSYSVTFTDGNGCSATSATTNVTVNPTPATPIITPSGSTTLCDGGSVDLTSSQASGNLWSTGETTQMITVTTSGSYSVTYTDGNGCSATSATTNVTVNTSPAPPTITSSGTTTFCEGGSVNLTSSQASGNLWSTGETTQMISVTTSGSYSVTYTDGNGCSATSATTNVTVNPAPPTPIITASGPTTFCNGDSVILTSSQATGIIWSTTENTQSITVTTSGFYNVMYMDANGCFANGVPVNVTVNPTPAAPTITTSGSTTFCEGGSVDLTSSEPSNILWSSGETTQTISVTTSGSYTVTYTAVNGCSATSAPVTVTVNPNPPAPTITPSGPTTFCDGDSVVLTSSQATGIIWSTTETTQSITVTTSGFYNVIHLDANGCFSNAAPVSVTVNSTPAAPTITQSGSTTFCAGGSVDLTSSEPSGNMWTTGSGAQTIMVTSSGSYSVTYTAPNGCSAVSTPIAVTVNASPTAPIITTSGSTTICDGDDVTLTSSEPTGNVWSNGETNNSTVVSTAGIYTVTFTDGNGCSATTSGIAVVVNPNPPAPTITASGPTTFCDGDDVVLTSSEPTGNMWSTGASTDSITASSSDDYTVTYTDGNGCSTISAPMTVTVNPLPTVSFIPTTSTHCVYHDSIVLTEGSPAGGVYSGPGVIGSTFDPGTAGVGVHTLSYTYVDTNGCENTATSDVTVDDCAGLDELANDIISVYPNPTFGVLNITSESSKIESIKVFDAAGRLIEHLTNLNQNTIQINMLEYAYGVYNLEIESENSTHRKRVMRN